MENKDLEVAPKIKRDRPLSDKAMISGARLVARSAKFGVSLGKKGVEKYGGAVTAGVLTMAAGGAAGDPQKAQEIAQNVIGVSNHVAGQDRHNTPGVSFEKIDEKSANSIFDMAFPTSNQLDREAGFAKVGEARRNVDANFDDEIVSHAFLNYESMVRQAAVDNQVPFEVLMGILLWESKGDENVESDADAAGLFQWTTDVAREEGLVVNDQVDERKDPTKIIPAEGRKFAKDLANVGSIAAAMQIHHMGLRGYLNLARGYLERNYGLKLDDIVVKKSEETEAATKVANDQAGYNLRLIRLNLIEKKITPEQVLKDPVNAELVSQKVYDKTDMFRAYAVASYNFYSERKIALGLK